MFFFANYLSNRRQRVVLNGKSSDWAPILSGVPQGSVLGPLLFLIFINDLEAGIKSKVKFFADDTSLYSIVKDPEVSARELNHDLELINNWAKQWKMSFNPDPTKPAEEILFSQKRRPTAHPPLYFNGVEVKRVMEHKHLGLILDPKLTFAAHLKEKIATARKGIGLIRYLQSYLPTESLIQIYKMRIRSHFDYCDFIYHIPELNNVENDDEIDSDDNDDGENIVVEDGTDLNVDANSSKKLKLNFRMKSLESVQYQAALAVTGAWKGTSAAKIYKELGWESLHSRRCFRRITQFFKIMKGFTPQYLVDPIPVPRRHLFGRRSSNDLYEFNCRTKRFSSSFYPDSVIRWNGLGPELRNTELLSGFKNSIIKTIQPTKKSIFNVHDPEGIKHIFQLRVGLSPLKAHKKNHNFRDTPNDDCCCGTGTETAEHFLVFCPNFRTQREILFSNIDLILSKLKNSNTAENSLGQKLLYGDINLTTRENCIILKNTIEFIRGTRRFSRL